MRSGKRRKNGVRSRFSPNGKGILLLCAGLVLVVMGGVLLPRLLAREAKETAPLENNWVVERIPPVAQVPVVNLPDLVLPTLEAAPPPFTFTEDEINRVNELLGAWAEEETFIRVVPEESDESGSSLSGSTSQDKSSSSKPQNGVEPQYVADGGKDVAVWFVDIQSGAHYSYNPEHAFSYASLMKAPYAAWLYTLAQDGACDLEEPIEVKPEDIGKYKENTGVLKTLELPASFTVETLIGYMLRNSDTVALKVLLNRYPAEPFKMWAQEQGVQDPAALNSVVSGTLTVVDAGALMAGVYRVMEYNPYGLQLRQHMESAGNKMITSEHPVARKYGWDENAYHDMGVVYAPHPFIVVIMTDKWGGSYAEMAKFGEISQMLESIMAEKWAGYEAENAA